MLDGKVRYMKQSNYKLNQITDYINEIINNEQGVGLSVAIVKDYAAC